MQIVLHINKETTLKVLKHYQEKSIKTKYVIQFNITEIYEKNLKYAHLSHG